LIILAIIAAVLATAPPELQRHIINTLAGHEKFERLGWLCGGYLIAALAIGGLKYIVNIRSAGLGEVMIRSLREEVHDSASSSSNPDATPMKLQSINQEHWSPRSLVKRRGLGNSSEIAFRPR